MKSDTTIYAGLRFGEENLSTVSDNLVTVDTKTLSPAASQRVYNHSPDGFNWGYYGSAPAQLALGILLDFTGDRDLALEHYQAFKRQFIASWGNNWMLTGQEIREWLEEQ